MVQVLRTPVKTWTLNIMYQSKVKLAGPWGRPALWYGSPSSSSRMDMEPEWAK